MNGELKKKMTINKLSEKYNAYIEFRMKSTLVASAASMDTLSMNSDVLSVDSGVDSEFDFDDFEEESKGGAGTGARKRSGIRKPAAMLKTSIKGSNDPTKPPLMLGKTYSAADGGFDPQKIIESSNSRQNLEINKT